MNAQHNKEKVMQTALTILTKTANNGFMLSTTCTGVPSGGIPAAYIVANSKSALHCMHAPVPGHTFESLKLGK